MATTNCRTCPDTYTIHTATASPAAPSLPKQSAICPTCGGLECLCRPRFFDGQLLGADDLTRLDRYIVAKNRLHNRYLHGWGVVCGLETVCDPCKDQVIVRKGYALSPCGDDIVVCSDVSVPVCDLITKCKRTTAVDCYGNVLTAAERGCEDGEEPWILSICYDEKPSRGITPLKGSSDCECTRHEVPAAAPQSSARYTPAQCEPSVLCEGFRFTVSKATAAQVADSQKWFQGEMVNRFNACLREFAATIPEAPADENDPEQLRRFCCEWNEALRDFFSTRSSFDCQLDEKLAAISCPRKTASMSNADYRAAWEDALYRQIEIGVAYLQYCLCDTLLPPCPGAPEENCVPLAVVTIQRSGCKILKVCNFSARRFALTVPALSYWLSWAPIGATLRNLLAQICCNPIRVPRREARVSAGAAASAAAKYAEYSTGSAPQSAAAKGNGASATAKETTQVFAQAWAGRSAEFDMQNLVLDALGAVNAQGLPFLSLEERRNPLATLLANRIAVPMANTFTPARPADISNLDRITEVRAAEGETGKTRPPAAETAAPGVSAADLEELRIQVETLKKTVADQQQKIDSLPKRRTRKG
jgi:hypothetical protein